MPDEVTPEATNTQAQGTETAPVAEGQRPLTLDDLKDFRNSVIADARRVAEGIAKPKNGKVAETAAPQSVDFQTELRREREFNDAAHDMGLTREQRTMLRDLVDAKKPEDIAEFVAAKAKAFGRSSEPAKPTTPARQQAASGHPVSDAGSPAAASASIDDGTPLVHMKPEDRAHFIKTKGLAAYANRLRAELKGVRVSMR
jgi:hypothetical protein